MTEKELRDLMDSPRNCRLDLPPHPVGLLPFTSAAINALQLKGQYWVMQAPEGYKFGPVQQLNPGDMYPSVRLSNLSVLALPCSNGGMAGEFVVSLIPLAPPTPAPILTLTTIPTIQDVYGMEYGEIIVNVGTLYGDKTEVQFGSLDELYRIGYRKFIGAGLEQKDLSFQGPQSNCGIYRLGFRKFKGGTA